MAKIIRLTESDLNRIVRKVIKEQRSSVNEVVPLAAAAVAGAGALGTLAYNWWRNNYNSLPSEQVKEFVNICNKSNVQPTVQSNQIADKLKDAIEYQTLWIFGGTDEAGIETALKSLPTFDEFCKVVKSYSNSYGSFFDDLDNDVSSSEMEKFMRPLRDLLMKQNQSSPKSQPTGGAVAAGIKSAVQKAQPTGGAPKPTPKTPVR
jgi:hypothetical protein